MGRVGSTQTMYFLTKIVLSALIIAAASETAKRFTPVAAVLASLPLTSMLTMIWLYRETGDVQKIMSLSTGIFWAVLPSLLFFAVLPMLLKTGLRFAAAMILSSVIMFTGYTVYVFILGKLGVRF